MRAATRYLPKNNITKMLMEEMMVFKILMRILQRLFMSGFITGKKEATLGRYVVEEAQHISLYLYGKTKKVFI